MWELYVPCINRRELVSNLGHNFHKDVQLTCYFGYLLLLSIALIFNSAGIVLCFNHWTILYTVMNRINKTLNTRIYYLIPGCYATIAHVWGRFIHLVALVVVLKYVKRSTLAGIVSRTWVRKADSVFQGIRILAVPPSILVNSWMLCTFALMSAFGWNQLGV